MEAYVGTARVEDRYNTGLLYTAGTPRGAIPAEPDSRRGRQRPPVIPLRGETERRGRRAWRSPVHVLSGALSNITDLAATDATTAMLFKRAGLCGAAPTRPAEQNIHPRGTGCGLGRPAAPPADVPAPLTRRDRPDPTGGPRVDRCPGLRALPARSDACVTQPDVDRRRIPVQLTAGIRGDGEDVQSVGSVGVEVPIGDFVVGGRYRLISLVAKGGMGRVWRAHDELLDRAVAVKEVLAPAGLPRADAADVLAGTVLEARAAARLDHPNVVRVFDVVQATGRSWIVMEYVASRSLQDVVTRDGPLTHRYAARVGLAVLDALRVAHQAGVLHRDVKPQNVLIADDGRVVLTDFGLATIAAVATGQAEPLLGSPHYIAPERLRDGVSSEQTDLWSLGATLYAAVEGRPPYSRPSVAESLSALLAQAPDAPQRPGPLHEVIAGLLTADPVHRLNAVDARILLQDLIHRAVGVHAVPTPRRPTGDAVRFRPAAVPLSALAADSDAAPEFNPEAASGPARPGRRRSLLLVGIVGAAIAAVGSTAAAWGHSGGSAAPRPTAVVAAPVTSACAGAKPYPLADSTAKAPISLPEGWFWHVDTAGFALPVPQGWNRGTTGDSVCFSDPGDVRSFTVQTGAAMDGEPLQHWQNAEQAALTAGALPGYQKVSMGLLLLTGGGADWEYSWQPATGPRLHTHRMLLAAGEDRSYSLTWTTRDSDWNLDLANQRTLVAGFRDSSKTATTWTVPGPLG